MISNGIRRPSGMAGSCPFVLAGLALSLWVGAASASAETVATVFKRVNMSVVTVRTTERDLSAERQGDLVTVAGLGSGVLVSAEGAVLTAAHVVHAADEVRVEFLDGAVVGARVVAAAPEADVALLRLASVPPNAVPAAIGNSDSVEVGDQVFIVGAPYGIGHTLTVGHVSARHKPNTLYGGLARAEFLQTDAAINRGNSGGPMFNMAGEVVGTVSHIISQSGGFEGLGFVVTSNMARRLLFERPSVWSGLDGYVLDEGLAGVFNVPQPFGLLVQRVARGSPSAATGLRGGTKRAVIDGLPLTVGEDIILDVQGIPATGRSSYEDIQERLGRLPTGARTRSSRALAFMNNPR